MTLTTHVRINTPVDPIALLDYMTEYVKPEDWGDRPVTRHGSGKWVGKYPDSVFVEDEVQHELDNTLGQGLNSLLGVNWRDEPSTLHSLYWDGRYEPDEDDEADPYPPAIVDFSMDNPYGSSGEGYSTAHEYHFGFLIPHLAKWLDAHGVPRTAWHWNDEGSGEWFTGEVVPSNYEQAGQDAASFASFALALITAEIESQK